MDNLVEIFVASNPFQGLLSQQTSTSSPEDSSDLQLREDSLKEQSERPKKRKKRRRRRRRKIKSIEMRYGGGNGRFDIESLKVYKPEEFGNIINNRES